jgi:hypothetical protein
LAARDRYCWVSGSSARFHGGDEFRVGFGELGVDARGGADGGVDMADGAAGGDRALIGLAFFPVGQELCDGGEVALCRFDFAVGEVAVQVHRPRGVGVGLGFLVE